MEFFKKAVNRIITDGNPTYEELLYIIKSRNDETARYLKEKAVELRKEYYGNTVFLRGLIEISNICRNDCYYCGIRNSNCNKKPYKLSQDEILESCEIGYKNGLRTFVLQSGEGAYNTDEICSTVKKIKRKFPDTAVTLSLGECSYEEYRDMFLSGVDRYLLRHETADKAHYCRLHPSAMSYDNRMNCLKNLREIGYRVGCGFMVGSPYQTEENIASDIKFISDFSPDMCGIGPFIPHKDTIFKNSPNGSTFLTVYCLSLIRIIKPNILLPSTTALATVSGDDGRAEGILSGANVIMPNLTPEKYINQYSLYDKKANTGNESIDGIKTLKEQLEKIGYRAVVDKGDIRYDKI